MARQNGSRCTSAPESLAHDILQKYDVDREKLLELLLVCCLRPLTWSLLFLVVECIWLRTRKTRRVVFLLTLIFLSILPFCSRALRRLARNMWIELNTRGGDRFSLKMVIRYFCRYLRLLYFIMRNLKC